MTIEEFIELYRATPAAGWAELDKPVLQYFSEHTEHTEVDVVSAKVALVNRVYRANLQMAREDAERLTAQKIVEVPPDDVLEPVLEATSLDRATLPAIVAAQAHLAWCAHEATDRWAHSWASKYLSFCKPEVAPILDRYSRAAVSKIVGGLPRGDEHDAYAYRRYSGFCEGVLQLAQALREAGEPVDLKRMDAVLYGVRNG